MNQYDDDEVCSTCNKNLNKVANGELTCGPCLEQGWVLLAQLTVLGHLWDVVVELFNFKFAHAVFSLMLAFNRAFKFGYYSEGGFFHANGYIKDDFFGIKKE